MAQFCKDVPADALISESHKFLLEVFAHLIQHDLLIIQFQLPLERVHIAEPEADEVIRNIVYSVLTKYAPYYKERPQAAVCSVCGLVLRFSAFLLSASAYKRFCSQ